MIEGLIAKVVGRAWEIGVIVAGIGALWWSFASHYEHKGAQKQINAQERTDHAAIRKADEVGAKSRNPAVRGMRDPYAGPGVGAAE